MKLIVILNIFYLCISYSIRIVLSVFLLRNNLLKIFTLRRNLKLQILRDKYYGINQSKLVIKGSNHLHS